MPGIATLAKAIVVAGGLAALPFTINSATGRIEPNTLNCEEGGKCCPEPQALCYPTGCSTFACAAPHHYWRANDGKKCDGTPDT